MGRPSQFREYTLDNGLHVVLQETPTQTIAGTLRVGYGAIHEREGEEGIAHFLEHAIMKGGSHKYSPEESDRIYGTLGFLNAFTNFDKTVFPCDMLAEDLELYLDFVSDLAFRPRLDPTRVNEERQRVLREMADRRSSPGFNDNQDFRRALFGQHPFTRDIIGNENIVEKATLDGLSNFHARGYNANNADLILVGKMPANVEDLISTYFGKVATGEKTPYVFPTLVPLEHKIELYRHAPDLTNQDNVMASNADLNLSVIVPAETSPDSASIHLLSIILGGDPNSRLFRSVSQRKGLAYNIGCEYDGTNNSGVIWIGGNVSAARHQEAIDQIFQDIEELRTTPVSQEELARVIRAGRYGIAKQYESNQGHVQAIERRIDTGITPESAMEKWSKVTPQSILEASQSYLPKNRVEGNYVMLVRDPLKQ